MNVVSKPPKAAVDALMAASASADAGVLEAAARSFTTSYPQQGVGWAALGLAHIRLGRFEDAIEPLRSGARLMPGDASCLSNLGFAFQQLGRRSQAETAFRKALERNPNFVPGLANLGGMFVEYGRFAEAEQVLKQALRGGAGAEAVASLGSALLGQGKSVEAVVTLGGAVKRLPGNALLLRKLGHALSAQHRMAEAAVVLAQAAQLMPGDADLQCELGGALVDLNQLDQAEEALQRALGLVPNHARALANMGNLRFQQARFAESKAAYEAAAAADPENLQYAMQAALALPAIMDSHAQIAELRAARASALERLAFMPQSPPLPVKTNPLSFYLAYHNADDRPLLEAQAEALRKVAPKLSFTAPHTRKWRRDKSRRARIGIVSEYLSEHTIGKLYEGYIEHLDRERFEIVLIHTAGTARDGRRERLDKQADKAITLPSELQAMQAAVAEERLDALFYPDIGMSPPTYYLAFSRLAPVQAMSWGHPDTSGLDTIDYCISADSIEPEGAEASYTERLVRMARLPCFYPQPAAPEKLPSRAELGLPETGTLYGCLQSLYKIHPDFDAVLAAIAQGDPDGHIVMIEGHPPALTDALRKRWEHDAPILNERVRWMPRVPSDQFLRMLSHIDVLLDPIHFGSGNTLYESMTLGIPVVTFPGWFARGRIVAAAYRQMGIGDAPVAASLEEYAQLATALGRDAPRREVMQKALQHGAGALYGDLEAVREFEAFLDAALDAADKNDRLPDGWRPQAARGETT